MSTSEQLGEKGFVYPDLGNQPLDLALRCGLERLGNEQDGMHVLTDHVAAHSTSELVVLDTSKLSIFQSNIEQTCVLGETFSVSLQRCPVCRPGLGQLWVSDDGAFILWLDPIRVHF